MTDFSVEVLTQNVPKGKIGVFWIGQAGFIFKLPDNRLIVVDPYFSDYCNRCVGFKRLMPYILTATDLKYDIYIASHAHPDHFDVDSAGAIMNNEGTELFCALDVKAECERLDIKHRVTYMKVDDVAERQGLIIKAVPCDHGPDTPHALGIILEYEGKKIYLMGDTTFRTDYFENEELKNCDLLILPINGAFGNLDETQAAITAENLNPKLTIPCHFWNFAEHGGNPGIFAEEMKKRDLNYKILYMGEKIVI